MPKTQVGIGGGGPSGLLLSQFLYRAGAECIVPEGHTSELGELDYLAESEAASNAVAENDTEQARKAP